MNSVPYSGLSDFANFDFIFLQFIVFILSIFCFQIDFKAFGYVNICLRCWTDECSFVLLIHLSMFRKQICKLSQPLLTIGVLALSIPLLELSVNYPKVKTMSFVKALSQLLRQYFEKHLRP